MRAVRGFWSILLSFWAAMLFSAIYGIAGVCIVRIMSSEEAARQAARFFVSKYGGIIAGSACATLFLMSIFVLRIVPQLIDEIIQDIECQDSSYKYWRSRFSSPWLGLAQFATYFTGGYAIYSLLQFPVDDRSQLIFTLFTALQYAFGGFVGRKLWCIGHMLRSIGDLTPRRDLLEAEALPRLIYIVNVFTFLTIIMVLIHTYFHSRIQYSTEFAHLPVIEQLVYLPVVLAIPVLVLFNFYPRIVANRLYLKSIRDRKEWLSNKILRSGESEIATFKHVIDYQKYLNEEFRHRQRLALSELPVALAILIAIAVSIVRELTN